MLRVLLALLLVLVSSTPARADTGLTNSVANTWFARHTDAALHDIAHQRVGEISCDGCFDHDGRRSGTAEVIGYNSGYPDPVNQVVRQWRTSPDHDAILSNTSYGRIGCAELVVGARHYFACVLAAGPLPPPPAPAPSSAPAFLLPDTALPRAPCDA